MKRTLLALAIAGLLLANLPALAGPPKAKPATPTAQVTAPSLESSTWLTSYEAAVKESQRTGKPIMMDFTGSDWCGWCKKLKAEVFETEQFKNWAAQNVVLLEVDFPRANPLPEDQAKQNEELAAKYGIQGFPTIVFADHTGEPLGALGYEEGGPEVWTSKAQASLQATKS